MKKTKNVKKKDSFIQKVVLSRGFYIALASFALIAGFSIYSRNIRSEIGSEVASFDDEAWRDAVEESGLQIVDIDGVTEKTSEEEKKNISKDNTSQDAPGDAVLVSASTKPRTQSPKFSMQIPCTGKVVKECSVEELVYCETMEDWRTHNGMDIGAKIGEPVMAAADGVVSAVYEDDLLGVVVVLDHGNDILTLYGNLQSVDFISVGTTVNQGDIIGGVGKTGALEADLEPHLHFEVKEKGDYKNPKDYLTA